MTKILNPRTRWECKSCRFEDETTESRPHSRMHTCLALGGLTVPMVEAGTDCVVQPVLSEDYGRRVVGIETRHADGHTDFAAYAGHATVSGEGLGA